MVQQLLCFAVGWQSPWLWWSWCVSMSVLSASLRCFSTHCWLFWSWLESLWSSLPMDDIWALVDMACIQNILRHIRPPLLYLSRCMWIGSIYHIQATDSNSTSPLFGPISRNPSASFKSYLKPLHCRFTSNFTFICCWAWWTIMTKKFPFIVNSILTETCKKERNKFSWSTRARACQEQAGWRKWAQASLRHAKTVGIEAFSQDAWKCRTF